MFGFIKKVFVVAMTFFWLECIKHKSVKMYFNEQSKL